MRSRFKQLGKDSLVYGVGGILAKSIGFFLLPVYTRIFTPADYGTIEMLVVLNSFLGSILVMGMDSAQSFYFFEQEKEGEKAQARVVTAILQWRITWGSGIVLLGTLLSPLLNKYFFNGQLSWEYFAVAFIGALFGQIMSQSAEVFRLLYRPWKYISITMGQVLCSAGIALTLIIIFGFGILGFFIGTLAGSVLATLFGWWQIREYLDFSRWHRNWWPRLIKFGGPLVPAALAMYVLNVSDRWFVGYYNGQDALGLYAVGAKIAMLIAMAVTTFRQAWWPVAMDAIHSKDGPPLYRTMARLYMGMGSASVVLITALSPYLVKWFTAPAYFDSYPIVGILAWHSIFYGFYLIGTAGIWKAEKTAWAPFLMGAAALLNIVLNFWLVPLYGFNGAAIATSVSFLIWNVLTIIISERLWRVGYDYGILLLQVTIGVSACWLTLVLYKQEVSPWSAWLVVAITVALLLSLSISLRHFSSIMLRLNLRIGGLQAKGK
jgi:O-antigen/teichoic acid export membrane protein